MGNNYVAVNVHAVLYHDIAMHINNVHPRCTQDVKTASEHPHITVLMEVYHYHNLEGSTDEQDCLQQILSQKFSSHKTELDGAGHSWGRLCGMFIRLQ